MLSALTSGDEAEKTMTPFTFNNLESTRLPTQRGYLPMLLFVYTTLGYSTAKTPAVVSRAVARLIGRMRSA